MNRELPIPNTLEKLQPATLPCIDEMFAAQATRTPGAIAVNNGNERLSYAELNSRSNQLAQKLRKLGVQAEVPVALYLDRSVEMVVSILGVLKAGGAYVPIDLAYPKDRLSFMLEDTKAPVLITQQRLRERLPEFSGTVICIDSDWPGIASEPAVAPARTTTSQNAAYIIYTSGSTGKPKGVIVTHGNVVRLLGQTAHWYRFGSSDVWPLFHSYAFDVSVWELWGSLFNGGRLVIVPYLVSRSPAEFYELLANEGVTVLNQTPSAFRQLIWAEETVPVKRALNLRYVICAGEALELQSLRPWFARHGDERPLIVNMYGITETTVHSTYRPIRKADVEQGLGSVIGVPIPDLKIHLVDEHLKLVPKGATGEICVGGAGVARGYLNRPELNAQRFLPDSFSAEPGARIYRSGDLARINEHGEMEYLGRMDHQVKIRGFRVELGEIESALNRHPAIRESVVIARDEADGGKRLVAYSVAVDSPPSVTDLREFLAPRLPDYMIPALFVFLKAFPLTTNGKIDRRALPDPDGARPELKSEFVAPRTPAEQTLAKLWSEVLGVTKVGARDNFFELGGDSIRSIQILARAQQAGLALTLQQMFQNPTIEQLAQCAQTAASPERPKIAPFSLISAGDRALVPADCEDAYPIAGLQLGMIYHNELDPLSAMYHDVFSFAVRAPFEWAKLEAAVNALAQRHPILRTSFHLAGFSEPLQLVHRAVRMPFTVEDLPSLGAEGQQKRALEWIQVEKRKPFDRTVAPSVCFHVQVQARDRFQFFVSFHHSCIDGWSLAALITEIFTDYSNALEEGPAPAAAPEIRYADFVALERAAVRSRETQTFWRDKLEGASPQLLPRWPRLMCEGGHEQRRGPEIELEPELLAGLRKVAQSAGVPLKAVLLAAHQHVMSYLGGSRDVISGLVCNGRPEEVDGEKMLGLFLNTVPLRQALDGGSWLDLVKQTFAAEQELLPHRRFPVSEIQKLSGGRTLFETAFDYVHFHVLNDLESSKRVQVAESDYFEANNLTTYTTFMLDASSRHLQLHIDYDPNTICRTQIEQLTDYYVATLRAMTSNPASGYDEFCPISEDETQRILHKWNATREEYSASTLIHELVERQAQLRPDAVAVVCGSQRLTYRELNERSNELARKLAGLGIGTCGLVGLHVERSIDMMVGLLGILKAGGAYVPLDPGFPRERLEYMANDAQLRALVTQRSLAGTLKTMAPEICIDSHRGGDVLAPTGQPQNGASVERDTEPPLAYVIYTSGSTGKPKGVQINHRSMVNVLTSIAKKTGFSERDNLLAVTTLSFDIAALELFMPLFVGGTVTIATRESASDGTQLAALIESSGATAMQATPATWRLLIESGWKGNRTLKVFCGGEALKPSLADELLKRSAALWNFYGPTETTIWSTIWEMQEGSPVLIGRPVANTCCYILNSRLQPLPVGAIGELYIGGDGVARGYLNRPELTAERFVPSPFDEISPRIYRTGDLARWLPDGTIECLGRVDHQVKIRGFRIELGEIETVLRQHAGIADALVTAREDGSGEKQLVAYLVSRNGAPGVTELRDFLKTKLPLYMVPGKFVLLEQFPLLPNGKLDMKRLPAPETSAQPLAAYVAPRSSEEQQIAAIWQEVLGREKISIADNFFELGGDSLSATRAFARINRAFGTEISLQQVFENPTIQALAAVVEKAPRAATAKRIIPRRERLVKP